MDRHIAREDGLGEEPTTQALRHPSYRRRSRRVACLKSIRRTRGFLASQMAPLRTLGFEISFTAPRRARGLESSFMAMVLFLLKGYASSWSYLRGPVSSVYYTL